MKQCVFAIMFLLSIGLPLRGQTHVNKSVPVVTDSVGGSPLAVIVKFTGSMEEFGGAVASGLRGMTFALYKDQTGGVPLWMETQTVAVDNHGRFAVLLGSTSTNGIPASAFASAEPQWFSHTLDDRPAR